MPRYPKEKETEVANTGEETSTSKVEPALSLSEQEKELLGKLEEVKQKKASVADVTSVEMSINELLRINRSTGTKTRDANKEYIKRVVQQVTRAPGSNPMNPIIIGK